MKIDANQENAVRPSEDSYVPSYKAYHPIATGDHKPMAVGHSITARSIPLKMRDELKYEFTGFFVFFKIFCVSLFIYYFSGFIF